jgi:tRNA pseudouridine55 synthase
MYSALKKDGKALYQYAREGVEIERQPRHIEIFQIDLLSFDIATNQLHIRVHCSKGTYLRTLAQDIARHCLSLAHLTQLKRINQNQWHLHDAIDVLTLRSKTPTERETLVRPMDQLLTHLPSIFLNSIDSARFLNGQRIRYTNLPTQKNVRVYSDSNQLLGIAKDIAGVIHPSRLLIEREGFDHD